jgi:low affinity Fe/Cu permease
MIARMIENEKSKSEKARMKRVQAAAGAASNAPKTTAAHASMDSHVDAVMQHGDWFGTFAAQASTVVGSKWSFVLAVLVIVVWAVTGPVFHFSDTWQLVINTGTTIVTFLMVFLIQNTQNRDARAINLKLNELIRALDAARDQMINIESLSDLELNAIQAKYAKIQADLPDEAGNRD